jgi:uncharacterized repeat protein (TIGR03803 family)
MSYTVKEIEAVRILGFGRLAVGASIAAVLFAGCGESQPPIGAQNIVQPERETSGWSHSVVYEFRGESGSHPQGGLLDVAGTLYGTTYSGGEYKQGTVYALSPSGTHTVLHSFGGSASDGSHPLSRLIDVDGTLYGTSEYGGASGAGTVYSVSPSGSEKVLYDFKGGTGGDGSRPMSGLIDVNGTLYGTTVAGGDLYCGSVFGPGCGTVYSITTSGSETVLYRFGTDPDGALPFAGLLNVNGTLYGTTSNGGDFGAGTVFSVSTSGSEKVLYRFEGGTDGAQPSTNLIDVKGKLYGTTTYGGGTGCNGGVGQLGCGVVYSISTKGTEKVLHRFCVDSDSDAANPGGGVLIDEHGTLFGTASGNGICADGQVGPGTIYSVTTAGAESLLYVFTMKSAASGLQPTSGVTDVNGVLYGETFWGGRGCRRGKDGYTGCGTVFKLHR